MLNKYKKVLKRSLRICLLLILFILLFTLYANWAIPNSTQQYIYNNVQEVPSQKVALVLGTSPTLKGGGNNPYFSHRIEAANELYEAGKVKYFILSGDNKHVSYNEPKYMRQALVKAGVPDSIIFFDFAGFRTFDSVIRAQKVFQQESFIVVSQQFHNERAVYLARYYGIEAYGYNAKDVALGRTSLRTKIREKLARVKVFIDIVLRKKPKFLGEPINIESDSEQDK